MIVLKSLTKLNYFKSKILSILEKQKTVLMEKSRAASIGEVRIWAGKKYKKNLDKKWIRIYETYHTGTRKAIEHLKNKVKNAKSLDELFEIVMNNVHRFYDKKGKILPVVEELKNEVDKKKIDIKAKKKQVKAVKFTPELKKKAEYVLNNPIEHINYVEYSREKYNKLFPRGSCETPIGIVKLGEHQFERLAEKDGGKREMFLGALYQCLKRPDVVVKKIDDRGRSSKLYLKAFLDNNGKKSYLAVVPTINDIDVVVSNSPRDTSAIINIIKKADLCYYIRSAVASSAKALVVANQGYSIVGLASKNILAEGAKLPDTQNVPQSNSPVNKSSNKSKKPWCYFDKQGRFWINKSVLVGFIKSSEGK